MTGMAKKRFAAKAALCAVLLLQGCALSAAQAAAPAEKPSDSAAVLRRADECFTALDFQKARAVLLEAFEGENRDPLVIAELARTELMLGRPGDAAAHAEVGLVWHSGDARLPFWLALAQAANGRCEEADATLARALEGAGKDETALYDLAEEFMRKGALSLAAAVHERIVATLPNESQFDIFSCLNLAAYYFHLERYGDAERVMRLASGPMEFGDVDILAPHESAYWTAIFAGMKTIAGGDAEEGLTRLRGAAADFPAGVIADALVVRQLRKAGRAEEAQAVYVLVSKRLEDAIAAKPENARAYNDIALFEATSETDAERGLRYADLALSLEPLRPEYYDTKSALLLQLGRYEDALISANRAISLLSSPRWSEPGFLISLIRRRLEIIRKMGVKVPDACVSFGK